MRKKVIEEDANRLLDAVMKLEKENLYGDTPVNLLTADQHGNFDTCYMINAGSIQIAYLQKGRKVYRIYYDGRQSLETYLLDSLLCKTDTADHIINDNQTTAYCNRWNQITWQQRFF